MEQTDVLSHTRKFIGKEICIFNIEEVNLEGSTAIIPTISVANVPQLTVDLVIKNTPCVKIGTFWHKAFLPYISPDSFDDSNPDLCTTGEVYFNKEKMILVFQIRSPILGKKLTVDFLMKLCSWLSKHKVANVIALSSIYSHLRLDEEIRDQSIFSEFRYIVSPLFKTQDFEKIKSLDWKQYLYSARMPSEIESDSLGLKYVGAGFSYHLYKECLEQNLPCLVLLKFSSDGYNIPDAEKYLQLMNNYLNLIPCDAPITYPISWKVLGDEGKPPPELY
ncbi:proteasome assembly chaperone 2 [Lycorma delicatula]|uniref:proteasome assembly chaperone 2 n=1 Tax=Lycorma delicatula TaxID=130591 RepID=UPI003F50D63D